MSRLNTIQLESAIAQCFNLSMDGQIAEEVRERYLETATLLCERCDLLESIEFSDLDDAVDSANLQLVDVNDQLADIDEGLGNIPDSLSAIDKLLRRFDTLVTLVEDLALETARQQTRGDLRVNFRS